MEAAAARARVRARRPAPRPPEGDPVAVRAPAGRRRLGRHRRPDRRRRRGGRRQRPGLPGARRHPRRAPELLPRQPGANASWPRWRRSSSASTTRPRRRCRGRSSSAPTCATGPSCSRRRWASGGAAPVEVRVAERGDKRRLRELAERNARLALDQDRLRREHRRQRRVESLADLREALGMEELPVRIEGFDISNLGGEHTVASMVVFEGGATKKADYRRFRVRGERRRARQRPRRLRLDGGGPGPADEPLPRAGRPLAARRQARRELRLAALPGRDRRRQGPALGGDAGPAPLRRARRHGDRPGQAPGGGLRARPRRADRSPRRLARPRSCCSGCATRPTASRSTTTVAAATGR